jgi:hypothetical protein
MKIKDTYSSIKEKLVIFDLVYEMDFRINLARVYRLTLDPSLKQFKKAFQIITPIDFKSITKPLGENLIDLPNNIVPSDLVPPEVYLFYQKLRNMCQALQILNYLPVIDTIRTLSVCKKTPTSTVGKLGLFGNNNIEQDPPKAPQLADKPTQESRSSKRQRSV